MRVYVFRLALLTFAVLGPVVARGDDQQIAEQIIQKLDSEKQAGTLKGFSIDLSVEEGTVWMSGRVATAEQHARALDIARRIPGVTQVVNDLSVNGSTTEFAEAEEAQAPASIPANRLAPRQAPAGPGFQRQAAAQPMQAMQPAPARQQNRVGGLFANFGSAMNNASRRGPMPAQQPMYQQASAVEEYEPIPAQPMYAEPTPAAAPAGRSAIGTGVSSAAAPAPSRRVVQAAMPVPESEAELATGMPLTGDPAQQSVIARPVYAQPAMPAYRGAPSQVPLAYAPARQVQYDGHHDGAVQGISGAPVPMHQGGGIGIAPARYDHPSMPGYAWPSYAAYPNYAAVTYPKQYSPTAWPYIGPFYPYPQVPLGWRKVTLEWDDGWWMLDFKDRRDRTH